MLDEGNGSEVLKGYNGTCTTFVDPVSAYESRGNHEVYKVTLTKMELTLPAKLARRIGYKGWVEYLNNEDFSFLNITDEPLINKFLHYLGHPGLYNEWIVDDIHIVKLLMENYCKAEGL